MTIRIQVPTADTPGLLGAMDALVAAGEAFQKLAQDGGTWPSSKVIHGLARALATLAHPDDQAGAENYVLHKATLSELRVILDAARTMIQTAM